MVGQNFSQISGFHVRMLDSSGPRFSFECVFQDGGCTCPGDVAKAFGAGADFVMVGGMLAGHDESGGEVIERNGKKLKLFYGMASATAMKMYAGGVAEYRSVAVTSEIIPQFSFLRVSL